MAEHPRPTIDKDLPADPAESLHIETPVIDVQDLEHQAAPEALAEIEKRMREQPNG